MPMERVHKPMVFLLAFFIAFLSLTTSSDGRTANLLNHNAKSGDKGVKGADHTRIPSYELPYPGEIIGYPQDPYGSKASMYFPASGGGFQDKVIGKDGQKKVDGQKGSLAYGGYPPNVYGYPPFGYGFPFPFPFPGGIFGFPPRGIFGFPFGFPPFRWPPSGYGGFPGGSGGSPGGYGSAGAGYKPGGGGYPGYGGKAEVKGKEVNPHD